VRVCVRVCVCEPVCVPSVCVLLIKEPALLSGGVRLIGLCVINRVVP
jgi:hypothetical protein